MLSDFHFSFCSSLTQRLYIIFYVCTTYIYMVFSCVSGVFCSRSKFLLRVYLPTLSFYSLVPFILSFHLLSAPSYLTSHARVCVCFYVYMCDGIRTNNRQTGRDMNENKRKSTTTKIHRKHIAKQDEACFLCFRFGHLYESYMRSAEPVCILFFHISQC